MSNLIGKIAADTLTASTLGWTKITVTGRNFEPFSYVYMSVGAYFDPETDIPQPIIYITPEQIVFYTLPHAAGVSQIRVTNREEEPSFLTFTFKDGPSLDKVIPSIISSEGDTTTVYITGTNIYGTSVKPKVFIEDYEIPESYITIEQN